MEIIALIATILTIITGIWFLLDKFGKTRKKKQPPALESIVFERTPIFKGNETLTFGKNTALIGTNGSGKTAVCEWLSALENINHLKRWIAYTKSHPIILSFHFNEGQKHSLRIEISRDRLLFNLDGNDVPSNPLPFKFVYPRNIDSPKEKLDDCEFLSIYLGIDKSILQNYAKKVGKSFYCSVNGIDFKNENEKTKVLVSLKEHPDPTEFCMLSVSEQHRVIIELAIAVSQFLSSASHVVLLIERSSFSIDKQWVQRYIDWIVKNKFNFQTIITSVQNSDNVDWSKFTIAEIKYKLKNSIIEQI